VVLRPDRPDLSFNDEEEEGSEDKFEWWKHGDPEAYIALVNCEPTPVEAGQQVFYCYGRRSNSFLLLK